LRRFPGPNDEELRLRVPFAEETETDAAWADGARDDETSEHTGLTAEQASGLADDPELEGEGEQPGVEQPAEESGGEQPAEDSGGEPPVEEYTGE
jgi:hypothetical protein